MDDVVNKEYVKEQNLVCNICMDNLNIAFTNLVIGPYEW